MAAAASPKALGTRLSGSPSAIKTVLFPRRTHDPLRVIQNAVSVAIARGVFHLSLHVTAANVDGDQLVASHAARQNLHSASRRIEMPLASLGANQRDRQRPVVVAGDNHGAIGIGRLDLNLHFFVCTAGEFSARILVFRGIAGFHDVRALRTENLHERSGIILPGGIDQGLRGLLRSRKRSVRRPADR